MNLQNKKLKKGFSVIELSIVLLIIGIVIGGIMQSSRLVAQFKLSSARTQAKNSPVATIPDLAAWYDATSADAFIESESSDSERVSTWYDVNPSSNNKHHVTANNPSVSEPLYIANCINNLPCIRFEGTSSYFTFGPSGGNFLVNSDYSIFIVEQRRSDTEGYFFGSSSSSSMSANDRLMIGYNSNTSFLYSQNMNDYTRTVTAYSTPTPNLHDIIFKEAGSGLRTYFINGSQYTLVSTGTYDFTSPLHENHYASIGYSYGSGYSGYFNGDIAEIIIYTRALSTVEREAVDKYLKKKWGII